MIGIYSPWNGGGKGVAIGFLCVALFPSASFSKKKVKKREREVRLTLDQGEGENFSKLEKLDLSISLDIFFHDRERLSKL